MSLLQSALQQTASSLSMLGLTMVFLAFALPARARLNAKLVSMSRSSEDAARMKQVIQQLVLGVRQSVLLQVKAAAITGVLAGVLIWALGMPDALFWSIIIFLIGFIPVVGGLISGLLVAGFALVELPGYEQAIAIFLGIQIVYLFVGSVLVPRMQSTGLNIDPTMGLASVGIWTVLWGIPGALLANSMTVLIMILFAQFEGSRWAAILLSNDGNPFSIRPPHPEELATGIATHAKTAAVIRQ
jgi:predicted PurR-regulated permease PerM